jgi:DNA-binding response OmpR family regulator
VTRNIAPGLVEGEPFPGLAMPRILVVEDEPRIASFVSRALVTEGFRVDRAGDGARALKMVELVMLDLLLPGVDGVTVLRGIIDKYPEQRVMVLSVLADVTSKVECLEIGASDYVTKPFSLSELLARVHACLRQPPAPAPYRFLSAGRVSLDMLNRIADAGRGPVHLSEREFELLQHLMRQAPNVRSREQLLGEVWSIPFETGSNVVDVTIRRLRAKLGNDVIETVRNAGYRINADG